MKQKFENNAGRVIILEQKDGDYLVFARTEAEELRAYLVLFKHMDEIGYYCRDGMNEDEQGWYDAAKQGNGQAAKWLLGTRSDRRCEYERINVVYVKMPLTGVSHNSAKHASTD